MTLSERRIALFLDFENLVTNTGITPGNFDLRPALDRLLEKGKVVFRRAYCDWSRFREAKVRLHEFGVELLDVPPSTRSGKNGADMRLVIDALELCYAREHIDTFVIGSGDSDFCPLVYKLRENGRNVIGLAVKNSTSPLFVKACDEFIYLTQSSNRPSADEAKHPRESTRRRGGARASAEGGTPAGEKIPQFVRDAVEAAISNSDGPLNPSALKQTLVRKKPDFDVGDLGFASFSKMLAVLEKEGLLKLQRIGRQWYVTPPEGPTAGGRGGEEDEDEEEAIPDPPED